MPGPGPKPNRRRRNKPALGEYQPVPGIGWQHGPIPEPPDGLVAASRDAWQTWFGSWFAAKWTPADLPGLRLVIAQYDAVQRGQTKANDITALVRLMDNYAITPAGQQARRWAPPEDKPEPAAADPIADSPYGNLRVVIG